jgi:hypothetical protein
MNLEDIDIKLKLCGIIMLIAIIYLLNEVNELKKKCNTEGLKNIPSEALENLASMYKSGDATFSNVTITGDLKVNGKTESAGVISSKTHMQAPYLHNEGSDMYFGQHRITSDKTTGDVKILANTHSSPNDKGSFTCNSKTGNVSASGGINATGNIIATGFVESRKYLHSNGPIFFGTHKLTSLLSNIRLGRNGVNANSLQWNTHNGYMHRIQDHDGGAKEIFKNK